jgi:SAM-dependent methyltransferase
MSARLQDRIREWWNEDAGVYDRSATHSLSDPLEAAAWKAAVTRYLPEPDARVLDAGAGTGAISLLVAELGHRVTALDLSPAMLARAREKAAARGFDIEFVEGPAEAPPPGPFDAVVERHLLWTTADPVAVLRAWRDVTSSGGRLVLFEGVWRPRDAIDRARFAVAGWIRRARGTHHDHHAPYDPEVTWSLPLARRSSPQALLDAVEAAGWRVPRIERLRDVDWARVWAAGRVLGVLEHRPQFAILATRA